MLTLVTELRTFRVSRHALTSYLGAEVDKSPYIHMKYMFASEVVAALEGERVSSLLLKGAISILCNLHETAVDVALRLPNIDITGFLLGSTRIPLCSSTLARHFSLVRDYLTEFPDARTLDMPGRTKIHETLCNLFTLNNAVRIPLDAEVLYSLQTLNPCSELYYFLYDLSPQHPLVVEGICSRITDLERRRLREVHRFSPCHLPLPEEGDGNAVLCATPMGRLYLCREGLALLPLQPSYLFLNACLTYGMGWKELAVQLIDRGFDDENPYYPDVACVVRCLVSVVPFCSDEGITRVLSMLGVGEEPLYPPYQVTILPKSTEYSSVMQLVIELSQREAFADKTSLIIETLSIECYSPSTSSSYPVTDDDESLSEDASEV